MAYSAKAPLHAVSAVVLVLAQRLPSGLAVLAAPQASCSQAMPTGSPSLSVGDAGAERGDDAGALMAGNERRRRLDRPVAVGGMQIGVADAAGDDLDQDFARARRGIGTSSIDSGLPNSWTTAAFIIFTTAHSPCFHGSISCWPGRQSDALRRISLT